VLIALLCTVHEALTEANEALVRQGLKRDLEAIHESS